MIMLSHDLESIHDDLRHRLDMASQAKPDQSHTRGHYAPIDTFLAVASRHNAGMLDAIAPLLRHSHDGRELAHQHLRASRSYEEALAQVKAKLYGSTYAVQRPWEEIWADVRRECDAVCELERRIVALLPSEADDPGLRTRLHHAELRAPTRPHPYIPHRGPLGHLARRVARHVDQFWDATEGRMIPEPVRHRDREHQGRLTQYLLADPHLPDEEQPRPLG